MGYRGEDLDLRTPQTWASAPTELAGTGDLPLPQNGKRASYRSAPILVDDMVLACCNHAYDVAAAHRAAEVRVEHLFNAMTRIDAATAALEARGVRVAALRRETAAIIASEIPAVAGNGSSAPRRSDELVEVLRLAASAASRRNAAVSIDDLLHVLLDQRSELPASELLFRFASRLALRDGPEPLPPLTRSSADLRYAAGAGSRYGAEHGRSYRAFSDAPTDAIQNSRIEALEQMVRALSQDLSNERHIVAGLVRDLSRNTQAHQDDQGKQQALLLDRIGMLEEATLETRGTNLSESLISKLESIETALELRLQEMSQSWAVLSSRLQELEIAVRDRPGHGGAGLTLDDIRQVVDMKPVNERLALIEEAVLADDRSGSGDFGDRFGKLEKEIARLLATSTDSGRIDALLTSFDRFNALADKFDSQQSSLGQAASDLVQRLASVEAAITAEIETAAAKHQAYTRDLTEVHDALMKLNQNQHTLAGSMDQWRTETAADVANVLTRIAAIDRDASVPAETLTALNAHMGSMNNFIIERYRRRHRFLYWLFGTDDWLGASWPPKSAAVDADRQRLNEADPTQA